MPGSQRGPGFHARAHGDANENRQHQRFEIGLAGEADFDPLQQDRRNGNGDAQDDAGQKLSQLIDQMRSPGAKSRGARFVIRPPIVNAPVSRSVATIEGLGRVLVKQGVRGVGFMSASPPQSGQSPARSASLLAAKSDIGYGHCLADRIQRARYSRQVHLQPPAGTSYSPETTHRPLWPLRCRIDRMANVGRNCHDLSRAYAGDPENCFEEELALQNQSDLFARMAVTIKPTIRLDFKICELRATERDGPKPRAGFVVPSEWQ